MDRSRTEGIVGREAELEALLRSADVGTPTRLVLLSGDAGVGKTRLLTEAVDRLAGDGWHPLVGHCLDFGDTTMPYLPFAEMLDQVAQSAPEVAAQLTRTHPALATLGRRSPSETAETGEGLDRAEVFEAVHAMVEELAARGPVVLVVEDAHWADASTRDLVSFLLSRRLPAPFLCVVTYRSDEMHRRHPLRQRVAEWVRLPGVERVQLDPLGPSAVRTMVEEIIGGAGSPVDAAHDDDVTRIVQRSQGNAFYVEELVSAYLGGGWSLPEDLADLLLVRLERLDETAREVVRVASAAGQRVAHDLLARVAPVGADDLDRALRIAIEAHVLVPVGQSEYSFRHALLGEAVYDDLLPGERMRLHTSYAEAVRELRGRAGAAELARHALASHDLPTALVASVDAGEQALATGGPDEAARHLTTALEVYHRAAGSLEDPPDEGELVARTVDALCSAGRPETGLALVDRHLADLPEDAPPLSRARLLLARVEALRSTEVDADPSLVSGEALELVGEEPTPLRARLLTVHAQALLWSDQYDRSRETGEQALELAERLDLPRLSADAALTLTWLSQHHDLGQHSRAELRRIIDDARARGDVLSEIRGHLRTGGIDYDYGELASAQEAYLEAARLAARIGRPWTFQGVVGRMQGALMALLRGEWDEALRIVDHRDEDPPPTPRAMLEAVAFAVHAGRGDLAVLDRLPVLRERWHREGLITITAGAAAIDLLARRDGATAAVAAYDEVVGVLAPRWGEVFGARLRLAALAVAALADEAPRTPTAERDRVRAAAERLAADAAAVVAARPGDRPMGVEGQAWDARLSAELLRLDWLLAGEPALDELVDRWREATDLFVRLGQPHEEARSRTHLATVLRAAGRGEESLAEATRARDIAGRLGARLVLEELGSLGHHAGRASTDDGALTPREREILGLVAQGRSNGEIGAQLFISAKTVSVHVSNLMAKLGAGSRTEAAALGRRRGLLPRDR